MIYFITGITGTVVPVIVEDLIRKDKDAFFYFAIRKDSKGNDVQARFEALVESLDLDPASKLDLYKRSKLVEIDIEKDKIGIDSGMYAELVQNTEKILHGAADVRFDQPYEVICKPNVIFTYKIYDLFNDIKKLRTIGFNQFYIDQQGHSAEFVLLYRNILKEPVQDRKLRKGYTAGHIYKGVD